MSALPWLCFVKMCQATMLEITSLSVTNMFGYQCNNWPYPGVVEPSGCACHWLEKGQCTCCWQCSHCVQHLDNELRLGLALQAAWSRACWRAQQYFKEQFEGLNLDIVVQGTCVSNGQVCLALLLPFKHCKLCTVSQNDSMRCAAALLHTPTCRELPNVCGHRLHWAYT